MADREYEVILHDEFTIMGHTVYVVTGKEGDTYFSEVAIDDETDAMQKQTHSLADAMAAHAEGITMASKIRARFGK